MRSSSAGLQRPARERATRAVADNPALASATGINVDRVIPVVWVGGAALAGLSGVLLGLTQGFDYQVGFKILLLVFAAVTLGGLGTIWGAIVGSFIIGLFIEVSTIFVPAELKFVGALVVLIVVLLIRPPGDPGPPRAGRLGKEPWTGSASSASPQAGSRAPTAVVFCLAAIGLNVHFGYTGLLNFGQAGFMAVGGYAVSSFVATWGGSFWLGLVVGLLSRGAGPAPRRPDAAAARGLPGDRHDRRRRDHPADGRLGQPARVLRRPGRLDELQRAFKALNPFSGAIGITGVVTWRPYDFWVMTVGWVLVALCCLMCGC